MNAPSEKELRKLDAWICEKAMGWKQVRDLQKIEKGGEFFLHETDGPFVHERQNYIKKFSPTTDPSAAMTVLEKCTQEIENRLGELDCLQIQWHDGEWAVCSFDDDDIPVKSPTLSLSICRFARKLFEK